ncbi:MAG: PVC-type heme-binding CxxCH protein, partial [Planctomycetota bacterium]|nr:PVC-type heme-binding CxxCH protein [Planctomycetota bacterium]
MRFRLAFLLVVLVSQLLSSQDANRLTYLDDFCDPYYPKIDFPKLTTPQWIGEEGVEAVITLGIDDMRDPARYESYLRPILDRLKKIDGRAPVSIMTNSVDPKHGQLKTWLKEGVSIECHTIDHPCPCLNGGNFDRAKSTYDRCVDLIDSIEGNTPVAFRFPCMDSLNTPSPRAFAEIVNQTTPKGKFLQISTSVTCLFTPDDPAITSVFRMKDGTLELDRFQKYVPFPSFVNQIQNYPYPYLIGNQCWEFPCTIPDDWQGQNIQRPHNPRTVDDLKSAVDATFLKKGIANIIFHPHNWIRAEQIVEVIDHVEQKYGKRVKFLTFKECIERINKNLLGGQPIRHPKTGKNNGVTLLDLNNDGYLDVFIGNQKKNLVRIWDPNQKKWNEFAHDLLYSNSRFGVTGGQVFGVSDSGKGEFRFQVFDSQTNQWTPTGASFKLHPKTNINDIRLRDINRDGHAELIVAGPHEKSIYRIAKWKIGNKDHFPVSIANAQGADNGVRFVDLDEDTFDDILISNDQSSAVYLNQPGTFKFQSIQLGTEIPRIVTEGKNGGVWFANQHLWVQNEHTNRLPAGVDRRSFHQILANTDPKPRSPKASLKSLKVAEGFQVELVAAEPLVRDPVALEWGIDGKLWVVEMADYPLGLDDQGKPGGRVRYLEDLDGDGTYDKSTLFVDKIPFPTGVLPTNLDPDQPACLISAAPYIVQANSKGDWNEIVANQDNVLLKGFNEGNQQHRFNGFSLGLDNWIYLANGDSGGTIEIPKTNQKLNINGRDLRIQLGKTIQFEAQTGQTQFGRHRDSWGNWFGCANPLPIRHYLLRDHYLKRNSHFKYPSPREDIANSGNTQIYPISRVLSHWSGYRPPAVGQPHRFTSACSTDFYRDNLFGKNFNHNTFTCEPVHNLIHRRILERKGLRFSSQRAESESNSEFLASSDSWFRPTTVKTGPDGALWITDMYRLVIEHPEWIDDQREKELFLRAGHDRGRIYRIVPRDKTLRQLPRPSWGAKPIQKKYGETFTNKLLEMLASANRWQTETAQRILVELGSAASDPSIAQKLGLMTSAKKPLARLHAMCTLDGRGELREQQLIQLLSDSNPGVRKNAIRISETFLKKSNSMELLQALSKRLEDESLAVRLQLAYSLGYSRHPVAANILADLGNRNFENELIRAAMISSLNPENIANVLSQAQLGEANPDFVMILLDQASAFGLSELAEKSLTRILETKDIRAISTRQLEMIVQIYRSISAPVTLPAKDLEKRSHEFARRVQESNAETDSARRQIASTLLISASPYIRENKKIEFLKSKISPNVGIEVQTAVVSELGKFPDASIARFFISQWRFVTPNLRGELFSAILQRSSWATIFLDGIAKKEIQQNEVTSSQVNQLVAHPDKAISNLASTTFKIQPNAEKEKLSQRYLDKFASFKMQPDQDRGKRLFEKHCSKCHRLGEVGNSVGPDLLSIKDRSSKTFVHAIIQPNNAVEDKYRSFIVALSDGREVVGMIQSETSNQVILATIEGKVTPLFRKEIEQIKSTGKSLMPEGLERELDETSLYHLVGYVLQTLETSGPAMQRKTFNGNKPALVSSSEDGS